MQKAKIVLAEDDARVRDSLDRLLVAWGYEVETARDGIEALDKIAQFGPAIVISDLRMPRLGGAQLVREARAANRTLPFILYSGMQPTERELADLHGVCFLEKPFDPNRLREEVRKHLGQ